MICYDTVEDLISLFCTVCSGCTACCGAFHLENETVRLPVRLLHVNIFALCLSVLLLILISRG